MDCEGVTMKRCVRCRRELADDALFCPSCGASQNNQPGNDILGTVVGGRYLVQELLGEGGSGMVYRARHVGLGRPVAVKLLHHHLSEHEAAIERFRREATTVAGIDNEHIIEVLDFGRAEDGRFFMTMELLEGESLAVLLEREAPLPLQRSVDIASQAADALAEVHAIGYVHRDLRPRNLFLMVRKGRADFVKILDFGLAKLIPPGNVSPQATLGMNFGDPFYFAPEQARGEKADRRTDIYSLAVIIYHMVTGRPPFTGSEVLDILDQQVEVMPQRPSLVRSGLPTALDAVLLKALAKTPDDRYVTMVQFREALQRAVSPETMVAGSSLSAASGSSAIKPPMGGAGRIPDDIAPDKTVIGIGAPVRDMVAKAAGASSSLVEKESGKSEPRKGTKQAVSGQSGKNLSQKHPSGVQSDGGSVQPTSSVPAEPSIPKEVVSGQGQPDRAAAAGSMETPTGASKAGSQTGDWKPGQRPSLRPDATLTGAVAPKSISDEEPESAGAQQPDGVQDVVQGSTPQQADSKTEEADGKAKPGGESEQGGESKSGGESEQGGEPEQKIDPTMSQMWYAEGEEAQARLAAMLDSGGSGDDDQDTEHVLPTMYDRAGLAGPVGPKRSILWVVGAAVGLIGILIILLVVYGRNKSEKTRASSDEENGKTQVASGRGADGSGLATQPPDAGPVATSQDSGPGASPSPAAGHEAGSGTLLVVPGDELVAPPSRPGANAHGPTGPGRGRPSHARHGDGLPRPPRDSNGDHNGHGMQPQPATTPDAAVGPDRHEQARQEDALGRKALSNGNLSDAAVHYSKALRLDGGNASALAGLGRVAFERGRYGKAISYLKRSLKRSRRVSTMVRLGNAYFKAGQLARAEAMYKKVLRIRPNHSEAKRNLQVVRARRGH